MSGEEHEVMYPHGDGIISGVHEETVDSRPKCGYRVWQTDETKTTKKVPCGSEDVKYTVKGHGNYGMSRETPVCGKHIEKALRDWNWESAKECLPGKR